MGDDFDLFPKRENLDPFSFGTREKKPEPDKKEEAEDLFGQDLTGRDPGEGVPGGVTEKTPSLPDLGPALEGPVPGATKAAVREPKPSPPVAKTPSRPAPKPADPSDGVLDGGPISEEKTFDEPVFDQDAYRAEKGKKAPRKTSSPFVVVGGALIIIIGLLYGALTYLKKDKGPAPRVSTPPVSVAVVPTQPQPVPPPAVDETPSATVEAPAEEPPTAAPSGEPQGAKPGQDTKAPSQATPVKAAPPPPKAAPPEKTTAPAPAAAAAQGEEFSVQVGALILDSSVRELEKKLRGMGYDPFLKEGSTSAMMNMLTVGPFGTAQEAKTALSRLKKSGIESNLRNLDGGGAIIHAGSYLLEDNATSIMSKIRSMGYPVKLAKKEARLPMTFVRVGHFPDMDEANTVRDELKGKGLEGIVVRLR